MRSILGNNSLIGAVSMRYVLYFSVLIFLVGCSATHQIDPAAVDIPIYSNFSQHDQCQYLGEAIGSEGQLYNYFFISNYDLTKGARDDLRNKAYQLGGNVIETEIAPFQYTTSTVFVGNVYRCP